ncbi:MAG: OadG family protein [Candidatus Limimorpha sp.]
MNMLSLSLLAKEPIGTHDLVITFGGFCIVIAALVVLFLIFTLFSKIVNGKFKRNKDEKQVNAAPKAKKVTTSDIDDEISVAIALALSLSKDIHDEESGRVTIKRIERRYSPWSSKIYGLNGLHKY